MSESKAQPQIQAHEDARAPSNSSDAKRTRRLKRVFKKFLGWINYHQETEYLVTINYSPQERQRQILKIVDDRGFNGQIFFVAASGFLATSYCLFSTNVITRALYFVHPPCARLGGNASFYIDLITLLGSILGMLLVGHLADLYGRKKLYGWELTIVITATLGLVQSGAGYMYDDGAQYSMDIYSWISWWRFALGFGIGAEYPISAIISAEWASTESRGTMLAAVKSMQSIARLLAYAIGLVAVRSTAEKYGLKLGEQTAQLNATRLVIDRVWRLVMGIAIVPAVIAIGLRLTIPETPRYYVDIKKDLRRAIQKALKIYPTRLAPEQFSGDSTPMRKNSNQNDHWYSGLWTYLTETRPEVFKSLLLITLLWGLMDAGFYGMSLDSYSVLETLTKPTNATISPPNLRQDLANSNSNDACNKTRWNANLSSPNITIYEMLENNSVWSLQIVSLASVLGSLVAILIVHIFRRRLILVCTFSILSVLFTITGATLFTAGKDQDHTPTIVFYALTQFVYNVGPNTMIFVMATEIFPTVYRGTFFALASAGGKVGAVIIRSIIAVTGNKARPLSIRLLALVPIMLLAAYLSWYLPHVQYEEGDTRPETVRQPIQDVDVESWAYKLFLRFKLDNKPLEEIASNPNSTDNNSQMVETDNTVTV